MLARALRSLAAPRPPLPLALLRVAVASIILLSPEPEQAREFAGRPTELWLAPPGMSWFLPIFGWFAPHLWLVERVLQASALLVLFGLWTRASLSVLVLGFSLLFGGAQLGGAVVHDMHLLWLLLILLVSPAEQVLSLDAWAAGRPLVHGAPSSAAALGTSFARVLLGLIYFFPGLHKLLDGGLGWASSRNLQNQLWLKWFQAGGDVPWPRVDTVPWLLVLGGIAVLIFELSLIGCVWTRRGRAIGTLMGLTFHALTQHFMLIRFPSLWACYVVLWGDGPARARARSPITTVSPTLAPESRVSWLLPIVGAALIFGAVVQGARGQTQAWPFACYPSFSAPAPDSITDLAVEIGEGAEGPRVLRIGPLPPSAERRPPRAWSTVWHLTGAYGDPISPARLQAFAAELGRRQSPSLAIDERSELRFFREVFAIAPEAYGKPPLARVLLYETGPQH
jgi:hypothetical protein